MGTLMATFFLCHLAAFVSAAPTLQGTISEAIGHLLAVATASAMSDSHLILSNYQLTQASSSASLTDFWRMILEAELVVSCPLGLCLVRSDLICLQLV